MVRLYEQLIQQDMATYSEFMIGKKYMRALLFFYSAYNLACAILDFKDPLINKKNYIWKKYVLSEGKDRKLLKKMLRYTKKDMNLISESMNLMNRDNEKMGDYGISIMPRNKGFVGILGFEFDNL